MPLQPAKSLSSLFVAALLAACGGDSDPVAVLPEETRAQDERLFTASVEGPAFEALSGAVEGSTSRWAGVLNGAAYRVEVPQDWNGQLVMYAHGYAGEGANLLVQNPSIRRYLIQNRYAWAASSYSKNFYDVRAGVEDTNALAQAFTQIAAQNGRALSAPEKVFITGHSMGGHIAAAAVEAETQASAINKFRYHGAVPMCGVLGDTELFNTFARMQLAAQTVAGLPDHPFTQWAQIQSQVTAALFATFPSPASPNATITPTELGLRYQAVLENLTGGERPLFEEGLAFGRSFPSAYGTFGGDGTLNGILNQNVLDTRNSSYSYTLNGLPQTLQVTQVITPAADANRLRRDGLRWIPQLAGNIGVPVVSIHTLGDLFVPFSMQQVYQQRVAAQGNSDWLVQRAIRGVSHCDFTVAEQVQAFVDMVNWEAGGTRPGGDNVVSPGVVADRAYGCTHTINTLGPDDSPSTTALRDAVASTQAVCTPSCGSLRRPGRRACVSGVFGVGVHLGDALLAPHQVQTAAHDDGRTQPGVGGGQALPDQPVQTQAPGQRAVLEGRHGRGLAVAKGLGDRQLPAKAGDRQRQQQQCVAGLDGHPLRRGQRTGAQGHHQHHRQHHALAAVGAAGQPPGHGGHGVTQGRAQHRQPTGGGQAVLQLAPAGAQRNQHAHKAHRNRPAMCRRHPLLEHRDRQQRDQQRRNEKQRVGG
jgi:hypothetical protein